MIKMKQKTLILILALIATGINFLIAEPENSPYLGEKATSSEIVLRDISVFPNGEGLPHKADPWGFYSEQYPSFSSVTYDHARYEWQDAKWQNRPVTEKRKEALKK